MSKIIVIGSGFGGLSAAARLAIRGHQVQLFEKRDKLGGRAYVYEINGFKFDGGPTVITAPWLFDEIWELAGRNREDYFKIVPLDPFYRIFDHTGQYLDYNADHDFTLSQIDKFNPADKEGYTRFIATTKEIFETGMALIDKPFLHATDMVKVAPTWCGLQSYRSVYGYVSKYIKNDFLRRCFTFHPLLIGGNPLDAASLYVLIHYLEREWGIHYAMGGTGSIVQGFGRLLDEMGVEAPQRRGRRDPHRRQARHGRAHGRRHGASRRRGHLQRRCGLDLPEHDPKAIPQAPTATAGSSARSTACRSL
jgi:phytoene desaturase